MNTSKYYYCYDRIKTYILGLKMKIYLKSKGKFSYQCNVTKHKPH